MAYYYIEDYLFNRPLNEHIERNDALFTVLPKRINKREISQPKYKHIVERFYKLKKVFNPIDYPYDRKFKRATYVKLANLNYYLKFYGKA